MTNIVLIGMPGAGKSSMGVILAKALRRIFIDTDIVIQEHAGRLLQRILDTEGIEAFMVLEESAILSLACTNAVIATGGSVVFRERAMEHLRESGILVYLRIPFPEMEQRLKNITTRGVVLRPGQSLADMYAERVPLYERYADITVDCPGGEFEACVERVIRELVRRDAADRAHQLLDAGDRHALVSALREIAATGDPAGKLAAAARDVGTLTLNPTGISPLMEDRIRGLLPPRGRHGRRNGHGGGKDPGGVDRG